MKKAHIIQVNVNDGSSMLKEWDPPMDGTFRARLGGGLLTDAELAAVPKDQALKIQWLVKGRVPEVLGMSTGPFTLAPALKDFLEAMEPGVHRFLPIEIRTFEPVDGKLSHGLHWLLLPPPLVDCVNIDETMFKYDYRGVEWVRTKDDSDHWGGGIVSIDEPQFPCTFYRSEIEGRTLWRFKTGADSSDYACSDEFWKFFNQNKMLGWIADKTCIVK